MNDVTNQETIPAPTASCERPTLRAPAYAAELARLPRGLPRTLERLACEIIADGYLTSRDDVEVEVDLLFMGM